MEEEKGAVPSDVAVTTLPSSDDVTDEKLDTLDDVGVNGEEVHDAAEHSGQAGKEKKSSAEQEDSKRGILTFLNTF